MNEKRSLIGNECVKYIKQYLRDSGLQTEKDIRKWIRWARRPDGPLFYATPTPVNIDYNPKDPEYIVRILKVYSKIEPHILYTLLRFPRDVSSHRTFLCTVEDG